MKGGVGFGGKRGEGIGGGNLGRIRECVGRADSVLVVAGGRSRPPGARHLTRFRA